jgi:hypothetical protein
MTGNRIIPRWSPEQEAQYQGLARHFANGQVILAADRPGGLRRSLRLREDAAAVDRTFENEVALTPLLDTP